jgi:hypothetical protein
LSSAIRRAPRAAVPQRGTARPQHDFNNVAQLLGRDRE